MKSALIVRSVIFITLLLNLISCKKSDLDEISNATKVSGMVTNQITGEPVPNMNIYLLQCDGRLGWGSDACTDYKTFTTDSQGNYSGSLSNSREVFYKIGMVGNDYMLRSEHPSIIYPGTHNIINFSGLPLVTLQLRVKVKRHDKNWLQVEINACNGNYWDRDLYSGANPAFDFDSTYYLRVQATLLHQVHFLLYDKIPGGYTNVEQITKNFIIPNVDTTRREFIIE